LSASRKPSDPSLATSTDLQSVTQKRRSFGFVLDNKRSLWLLEHSSA